MFKRFVFLLLLVMATATCFSQAKVLLLPVLHGLHKTNTAYNYDTLQNIIRRIQPGIVVVEMRSFDLAHDSAYLKKNYPLEMWMSAYWFPGTEIAGYDWLGEDLEGRQVPDGYWKNESQVKKLERQLNGDSLYFAKLVPCEKIVEERLNHLKHGSVTEIMQKDGPLVKAYYDCLRLQLKGSIYESLVEFYNERNEKMKMNIGKMLAVAPGATVVILTGADHYPYLLDYLRTLNVVLLQP